MKIGRYKFRPRLHFLCLPGLLRLSIGVEWCGIYKEDTPPYPIETPGCAILTFYLGPWYAELGVEWEEVR